MTIINGEKVTAVILIGLSHTSVIFTVLFSSMFRKEGCFHISFSEAFTLFHTPGCLYIIARLHMLVSVRWVSSAYCNGCIVRESAFNKPKKRVGFKIFKVGSIIEYAVALTITFSALQIKGIAVISAITQISAHLIARFI